jgi:hypothetical protein
VVEIERIEIDWRIILALRTDTESPIVTYDSCFVKLLCYFALVGKCCKF